MTKNFLQKMSIGSFLNEEVLYKRSGDLDLLRCVDEKETEYLMKEAHTGTYKVHMNVHLLAKKIMRTRYF